MVLVGLGFLTLLKRKDDGLVLFRVWKYHIVASELLIVAVVENGHGEGVVGHRVVLDVFVFHELVGEEHVPESDDLNANPISFFYESAMISEKDVSDFHKPHLLLEESEH